MSHNRAKSASGLLFLCSLNFLLQIKASPVFVVPNLFLLHFCFFVAPFGLVTVSAVQFHNFSQTLIGFYHSKQQNFKVFCYLTRPWWDVTRKLNWGFFRLCSWAVSKCQCDVKVSHRHENLRSHKSQNWFNIRHLIWSIWIWNSQEGCKTSSRNWT